MGTGAYVKITNASSQTIEVFYSNMFCMYSDGDQGSDFRPITATIPPGMPPDTSLPKTGTQYIESNGSGECVIATSTFNMNFNVYNPDKETATFCFQEGGGPDTSYLVDGGSVGNASAGGVTFMAAISSGGDQQNITVVAY